VFFQTVSHRDYFLPPGAAADGDAHAPPPTPASPAQLRAAAGRAGRGGRPREGAVARRSSVRSTRPARRRRRSASRSRCSCCCPRPSPRCAPARANRLQTSLNLALGSALASIGLTIPVVAVVAVWLGLPLVLGLEAKDLVLLALSFVVASITLVSGRTTMLQGAVHATIFAAFLFLALVP
jgi:Ca2+:H+ antiporter